MHILSDLGEGLGCAIDARDPCELLRAQVRLAKELGAVGEKVNRRVEVAIQGGEQLVLGFRESGGAVMVGGAWGWLGLGTELLKGESKFDRVASDSAES